MKLLITDAYSSLGGALTSELEPTSFHVLTPTSRDVDWLDSEQVKTYLQSKRPDIIVNTAGWADTPSAEQQTLLIGAAKQLARACAETEIPIIHLSSYRVFGGENKPAYDEKDRPSPLTSEGRAFWEAEQALEKFVQKRICLRFSWVISGEGDNRLTRLLPELVAGNTVQVSADYRGAPTTLADAARVVIALVKQVCSGAENWGILHYCSNDVCTEAEFAEQVANVLSQENLLQGNLELAKKTYNKEPQSAVLKCLRSRNRFGIQPRTWRPGLKGMIQYWCREHYSEE